jgi:hypothetical protein
VTDIKNKEMHNLLWRVKTKLPRLHKHTLSVLITIYLPARMCICGANAVGKLMRL